MGFEFIGTCPLLQVFDMPASIAFYCGVLGFEIVNHSPSGPRPGLDYGWVLLERSGVELMLNTAYEQAERPPTADPARVAAHGDTMLYFGCEDLDAAYAHLRSNGIAAREPKVAPYGMRQLHLSDPDGYGLCFQWPASQQNYDQWVERYGLKPMLVE
ncbi:hypothetical protein ACPOL_1489 [Acidisarcina polymorpha]|uniref:VOC domain-containing protein n=1 Tax=Acidisarcina polymorpha TaxID=2211140 RepID=A0A2Z5FWS5_9BACT|nr:VOC family protein [Acidisarcina polymorpha]AXC10835.1 hypothetical protein ACPOL_1489 [Acidisarcina polymorpha]